LWSLKKGKYFLIKNFMQMRLSFKGDLSMPKTLGSKPSLANSYPKVAKMAVG
jgi:hypothetical protein